jgi:hypothetical protein
VFSAYEVERLLRDAIGGYLSDVAANRNEMLAEVDAAVSRARFAPDFDVDAALKAGYLDQIDAESQQAVKGIGAQSVAVMIASEIGGFAARNAAVQMAPRVMAVIGGTLAPAAVSMAASMGVSGGAMTSFVGTGTTLGTLGGPGVGNVIGAAASLTAGLAVEAVNRAPGRMAPLVRRHGEAALRAAGRHPGVGPTLLENFSARGAALANRLSTDQVIGLLRHRGAIRSLSPQNRSRLLEKVLRTPGRVVSYLERHPRVLYTAAGLTAVLNLGNRAMEPDGVVRDPDGTIRPSSPLDRMVSELGRRVFSGGPLETYLALLAVLVAGMLAFRILAPVWRFLGWAAGPFGGSRPRADRPGTAEPATEAPADSRR